MNIEELREYALSLKNVSESFPFGNDTLVFKVDNKIFLLASLSSEVLQFNVKCNPEYAVELREQYSCILPGYHMNKKHWNTVEIASGIPDIELRKMIDHSYELVVKSSTRKVRTNRRRVPASRSCR